MIISDVPKLEIQKLLDRDPYLTDHKEEISRRFGVFQQYVTDINEKEGGIEQFSLGHKKFGPQTKNNNDILVCHVITHDHFIFISLKFSSHKYIIRVSMSTCLDSQMLNCLCFSGQNGHQQPNLCI